MVETTLKCSGGWVQEEAFRIEYLEIPSCVGGAGGLPRPLSRVAREEKTWSDPWVQAVQ